MVSLADLGAGGSTATANSSIDNSTKNNGKLATGNTTSIEERALQLLGSGISAEATANALGVTPSRISQLLSEEQFSDKVATVRYNNLQRHNQRDDEYDNLEDTLIEKLKLNIGFLMKPTDILRAITVVNNAKRRGQSSPDQVVNQQNIVNLVLPAVITERFAVNIDNQVIRAGDQELHTMDAASLLKRSEKEQEQQMSSSELLIGTEDQS